VRAIGPCPVLGRGHSAAEHPGLSVEPFRAYNSNS
jgi:hypothetical protein